MNTKTTELLDMSVQLDAKQHAELVPMQSAMMPTSTAVFAEPVISAQPIMPAQKRHLPSFMQRMKVLAQMAGEDYRYSFPVKQKTGGKKTVEGGTIKMANDLVREYGNCMVDVRVVDQGDSHIFYARFVDYETGFCMTRPFRQRKSQRTMGDDPERAQDIVFQIGASKAIRNVVLNALGTFADFTYEEARNALVGKIGQDVVGWRGKIVERCKDRGYDVERIELSIGKKLGEWLAVDIARVVAELKSVTDGMATFDDLYPKQETAATINETFLTQDKTPPKKQKKASEKEQEPVGLTADQAFDRLVEVLTSAQEEDRPSLFLDNSGLDIMDAVYSLPVEHGQEQKQYKSIIEGLGIKLPD